MTELKKEKTKQQKRSSDSKKNQNNRKDKPRHSELDSSKSAKKIFWISVISIFFSFMFIGTLIGFTLVGGGKIEEFFNIGTWLHIFNIINQE